MWYIVNILIIIVHHVVVDRFVQMKLHHIAQRLNDVARFALIPGVIVTFNILYFYACLHEVNLHL